MMESSLVVGGDRACVASAKSPSGDGFTIRLEERTLFVALQEGEGRPVRPRSPETRKSLGSGTRNLWKDPDRAPGSKRGQNLRGSFASILYSRLEKRTHRSQSPGARAVPSVGSS